MIEIEYLEEEIPVYDITVEDNHNFFANDILVHNCLEINLPSFADEDFKIYTSDLYAFKSWFENVRMEGKWIDIYKILKYKKDSEIKTSSLYIRHPEIVKEFFDIASLNKDEVNDNEYTLNFGEIFSCILGGINFGYYGPDKDKDARDNLMFKNMFLLTWFLDSMIDYQDYAGIKPFENFTKNRRALGISPGNLYYLLAQYNADYSSLRARQIVDNIMETMNYTGILSSVCKSMIDGKCYLFNDTKYSKGILPRDTYNKNVDEFTDDKNLWRGAGYYSKWLNLKKLIQRYGMRNSTLFTAVPSSNSSRPGNMISGINPPQGLDYVVKDKKVSVKVLVPEVDKYKDFYKRNLAWDHDAIEYWKLIAVIQKWTDQSISLNEYVDYTKYSDEKIPDKEVLKRDAFTIKYGIKALYYIKPKTTKEDSLNQNEPEPDACASGGCNL